MPLTSPANPLPLPQVGSKHILWRCFGYLRPYWRITVGAYLTLFGITGLSLAIPQLIRWIVDAGIGGRDVGLLGQAVLALRV